MIKSLQKIEFVHASGATTLLLDYGDFIESDIEIGSEQQTTGFSPIGAMWGLATAEGGARRSFSFSRRLDHGSHTAVRSWCFSHPSLMPFGRDGVLKISTREADDAPEEIWQMQSAIVQGCAARPLDDGEKKFRSLTTYQITGGSMIPIEGNFGNCYPIDWQTYNIDEDETIIDADECEVVPPYVPDEPNPSSPPSLVPEVGVPGFTVSGIVTPSSFNGHYSFSGYRNGHRKYDGPGGGSVVYVSVDGLWELGETPFVESQFYTDVFTANPWDAVWLVGLGSGAPVFTPDP